MCLPAVFFVFFGKIVIVFCRVEVIILVLFLLGLWHAGYLRLQAVSVNLVYKFFYALAKSTCACS